MHLIKDFVPNAAEFGQKASMQPMFSSVIKLVSMNG